MLFVAGGIGLPLAYVLPERFAWRPIVAPMLGIAVISLLAPVAYHWGVPIPIFFYVLVALAIAGIALHARHLLAEARRLPSLWILVGAWLACTLLLLLPRWIGGDQFSVFQG